MRRIGYMIAVVTLAGYLLAVPEATLADSCESTRVVDENQYAEKVQGGYPYREKSIYVLWELDLKHGNVVADIGAGDGWWAEKMAPLVGKQGVVYAGEVAQSKVDKMKKTIRRRPPGASLPMPNR